MAVTYSTLDGIPSFQSGIGDGLDLRVQLRQDLEGRWYPVLQPGTFYLGTTPQYLYGQEGSTAFSVAASGTGTRTVTSLLTDPTSGGPVQLVGPDGTCFQRVVSPLRVFRSLQLSGSGELRTAATSGLLLAVCSHPTSGVYLQVPASGDLVSTEEYTYSRREARLWLRDSTPPALWATYVVEAEDSEALKLEEQVVVDRDGYVRVQYRGVCDHPSLAPWIRKPTRTGETRVSGTVVSGNVVAFTAPGITSGDLVAVEYYLWNSFVATHSGGTLTVRYLAQTSGTHTLLYETGTGPYDTSRLAEGATNRLQLNPLFTAREPGFLYLVETTEPRPLPRRIRLAADDLNPSYRGAGGQARRIVATVYDGEDCPIPGLTVATSGTAGTLTAVSGTVTDGRGQVAYQWSPSASGEVTLTTSVTVSGQTVTDTLQLHCWNLQTYLNDTDFYLGKLFLVQEEAPYQAHPELYRLFVYYCYPDGCPYQPAGVHSPLPYTVTLTSERSLFYTLEGKPLHNQITLQTDGDGVAQALLARVPGDRVRATLETVDAAGVARKRIAAPLQIPEALEHG
jgi:hypothetical protein